MLTTALLIPSKSNQIIRNNDILYNGSKNSACKSAKYLSVHTNRDLNSKHHIQLLHNKLPRTVGLLYKDKTFLPKNVLFQLYHGMFNSHLLYCITIWTSTFSTYPNSTRILQNKAVKLLAGIDWRDSSAAAYKLLGILKLDNMIKFQTALFVHSHYNSKLPPILQSYYANVNTCHLIATRQQACGLNYHIPRYRTSTLNQIQEGKNLNFNSLRTTKNQLEKIPKIIENFSIKELLAAPVVPEALPVLFRENIEISR